jgi:ABC-type sugar transport system permease subunit
MTTAVPKPKKRRSALSLSGRDRTVFFLMVAIPTFLHVSLVWIPTLASIFFSFTDWNGFKISDLNIVGLLNYEQILTVFEKDFFQAVINNLVLLVFLFVGPTLLGMVLAYLLDKNIKGTRVYQSMFYTPVVLSLAVVGFIWQSVVYSTEHGLATSLFGGGDPVNWIGNQSFLVGFSENYGISKNFVAILIAIAWRHTGYIMVLYLAGMKSVDPVAARIGCPRRLQRMAGVPPRAVPDTEADQRGGCRHHRDRGRCGPSTSSTCSTRHGAPRCCRSSPRTTSLGEGGGNVGRGSAYAVILFLLCIGFVIWYVTNHYRESNNV